MAQCLPESPSTTHRNRGANKNPTTLPAPASCWTYSPRLITASVGLVRQRTVPPVRGAYATGVEPQHHVSLPDGSERLSPRTPGLYTSTSLPCAATACSQERRRAAPCRHWLLLTARVDVARAATYPTAAECAENTVSILEQGPAARLQPRPESRGPPRRRDHHKSILFFPTWY